ncbi:hypothetical protein DH2020_010974 [Rehmannia glutinosa]|uniref:Cytochrome P450 protein n=1 Tax=Rehmannia glutinosa TaxID=99300 RepID=A0ABR0XC65_REHGL
MNLLDVHPALLISALILTLSILCSIIKLIKSSSNTNTPPGPRGFPIVGYLPFLRRDLHHLLTELSHQYGPIFKLRLGDKLWIVINSPSLLKEWRSLRKIFVREMLSNNNLKATYNLRKDEELQKKPPLLQRVDEIIEDTIHEWMKNPHDKPLTNDGRTDFMQILVDLMREEDNKASLGKIQIKALIVFFGTDTSATTIEWAMTELLNHPEMMEKVQQELNEVVGLNNIVEEFHIPKLDYLDAVLKETLRMHPVLPLSPRNPSQSCTVGGYTIPKGSTVLVNIWSVQMDPLAWDNPSEFRPERFLGNNGKWDFSGNDLNYIPFRSGRRACAGIPLAERMVRYILASFLHSYEWRLPDEEKLDMSDKLLTTLRKRIPLIVVPAPRLSRSDLYE